MDLEKTTTRKQGFQPGVSGNPKGRPKGSGRTEAMKLGKAKIEAHAEQLVDKALKMALEGRGNASVMIALLKTFIPQQKDKGVTASMKISKPNTIEEAKSILADIACAVASGEIDSEAARVATGTVTAWIQAHEAGLVESRLQDIEKRLAEMALRSTASVTNIRKVA